MTGCKREVEPVMPDLTWDLFDSAPSTPLPHGAMSKMEGVYQVIEGADVFGPLAVLKWSYTKHANDTIYHLSIFTESDVSYFITEGRKKDNSILFNGYWRKLSNTETGIVRLSISAAEGADFLFSSNPPPAQVGSIILRGVYGLGQNTPVTSFVISNLRPLNQTVPFEIIAHRGGGRNADLLPASENSVEMLLQAARFGATGVEIDVRLTQDGVPILYHDETLNERLVVKNGMLGPIKNYTYQQLSATIKLTRGGSIPTLRQGLQTILEHTPIKYVWLDIKYNGPLQVVRDLQQEFTQLAASMGKPLEITIGIPDEDVYNNFLQLPGYQNIPSLVELDPEKATAANARIWAPMFTKGLQNEEVLAIQGQGRRAFVWTVDGPNNVRKFMYEGKFNGILSNQPSIVAYYYYAK